MFDLIFPGVVISRHAIHLLLSAQAYGSANRPEAFIIYLPICRSRSSMLWLASSSSSCLLYL